MIKKILLIIFLILLWILVSFAGATAKQVALSDTLIDFGSVETGITHNQTIYMMSDSPQSFTILSAEFEEDVFNVNLSNWEIPANGSVQLDIEFNSDQNINYVDFLRIQIEGLTYPLIARVEAQGDYPGSYYDLTQNKFDEELKSALNDIIGGHTSLGYNIARDNMYGSIDNVAGYVECVYTGRTAEFNTRPGATANDFNCEHTWPQSFFFENEPMRSDIFHLYPTDVDANSRRGNLDFGEVVSSTWSEGGSALGTDASDQTVFEPRDAHKGNVARSHFYFAVRYDGEYIEYVDPDKMESLFMQWHVSDPVDAAEQLRNESIYALQNNRNPFIDHPEFTERIHSLFDLSLPVYNPEIAVTPTSNDISPVAINENIEITIALINSGNATLNVSSISSSNAQFEVSQTAANIDADDYHYIRINYTAPGIKTSDSTRITITSNDADEGSTEIPVKVEVFEPSSVPSPNGLPITTELLQNYPNPFNAKTIIRYIVGANNYSPLHVNLEIYNIHGQKIATLVSENQQPGEHSVTWNANDMASGIYYYRLQADRFTATRRMILIK